MADSAYKPVLDTTRALKFYNATGSAIGANLVLVPDSTAERGARPPTASEVIKEIVGVTFRSTAIGAEGDVVAVHGDVAVCTAYGALSKGDRVYVSSTASYLGFVKKFTGFRTDGAQYVLGVVQNDAADGSTVAVRLTPHRVAEGMQSGKATLVAGTVDVIGVRIPSGGTRILLTRNTPGGTAGHLSAADSKRLTSGQFTIDSSTNGDASTVDWVIFADD